MTVRQGRRKEKAATAIAATAIAAVAELPGALQLDPQCTLRESAALKSRLLERLDQVGDVELDAGAVEKIDTAGLQLLVAFARQLRDSHRALGWKSIAPELLRSAAQLGLTDVLGLPRAEVVP
jgi:anti-anti-sigma regulatory factor